MTTIQDNILKELVLIDTYYRVLGGEDGKSEDIINYLNTKKSMLINEITVLCTNNYEVGTPQKVVLDGLYQQSKDKIMSDITTELYLWLYDISSMPKDFYSKDINRIFSGARASLVRFILNNVDKILKNGNKNTYIIDLNNYIKAERGIIEFYANYLTLFYIKESLMENR